MNKQAKSKSNRLGGIGVICYCENARGVFVFLMTNKEQVFVIVNLNNVQR